MSTAAKRLGKAVKDRRLALGLSQDGLHARGGPSGPTLTTIENGLMEALTASTAKKLDAGLAWESGSARALFDRGRQPVELTGLEALAPADRTWYDSRRAEQDAAQTTLQRMILESDADATTKERLLLALHGINKSS